MALQPGPGTNCIAHEDGSELTMQSGTMASLILDCIPREGMLDDPRSNEDQYGVVESRSFPPSELLIDSGSRDIGVLNELHNKENQTKRELRQARAQTSLHLDLMLKAVQTLHRMYILSLLPLPSFLLFSSRYT
jgi:hypothetical protein